MARPLRLEYEGALYHITARGNERKNIFLNESDWKRFLTILKETSQRHRAIIHAYCLMNNHYHILLETPNANLSRVMHSLNTAYTVYFNCHHKRRGHLFQGRYKAILVDKDNYLIELSRYIHLNPVRARLVRRPQNWSFSSYRDYISLQKEKSWIDKSWIYAQFDRNREKAKKFYREFVEEGLRKGARNPFKDVFAQLILGQEEFIAGIRERIENLPATSEVPSLRRLQTGPRMEEIVRVIAGHLGVKKEEIRGTKGRRKNIPGQIAVYLARKYVDMSTTDIGKYFGGVGYSAVSQTVRRLEKRRTKRPPLDRKIRQIEEDLLSQVKT